MYVLLGEFEFHLISFCIMKIADFLFVLLGFFMGFSWILHGTPCSTVISWHFHGLRISWHFQGFATNEL